MTFCFGLARFSSLKETYDEDATISPESSVDYKVTLDHLVAFPVAYLYWFFISSYLFTMFDSYDSVIFYFI